MLVENYIALGVLIVSIVSVVFTALTLKIQRIHNEKSVKPIAIISAGDFENDIFISIENKGVGPMIIKNIEVKNPKKTTNSVIDIIPENIVSKILWSTFVREIENKAIAHGGQLILIQWKLNYNEYDYSDLDKVGNDLNLTEQLRKALKDITIYLEYTDIYEKNIFKTERSMQWFGRRFE